MKFKRPTVIFKLIIKEFKKWLGLFWFVAIITLQPLLFSIIFKSHHVARGLKFIGVHIAGPLFLAGFSMALLSSLLNSWRLGYFLDDSSQELPETRQAYVAAWRSYRFIKISGYFVLGEVIYLMSIDCRIEPLLAKIAVGLLGVLSILYFGSLVTWRCPRCNTLEHKLFQSFKASCNNCGLKKYEVPLNVREK